MAKATALLGGSGPAVTLAQQVQEWATLEGISYDAVADGVRDTMFALKNEIQALPPQKVRPAPAGVCTASGSCSPISARQAQVSAQSLPVAGLPLLHRGTSTASLNFQPPHQIDVVGSYMLRTVSRANAAVDLVLVMPHGTVTDADRKNFMVHDKMRLYLRVIASSLQKSVSAASVGVGFSSADPTALHLSLAPAAWRRAEAPAALKKLKVHIHAVPPSDAFQVHLLRPAWNNVVRWLHVKGTPQPHTPGYNSQVLAGSFYFHHLRALHNTLRQVPCASSLVVLLKAWLRARGLAFRVDGFSSLALTALVAALAQQGVLRPEMTTFQAARATLLHLSHTALTGKVMRLEGQWQASASMPGAQHGSSSDDSDSASDGDFSSEDEDEGDGSSDGGASLDASDSDSESDEEQGAAGVVAGAGPAEQAPIVADEPPPTDEEWRACFPLSIVCSSQWVNLAWGVSAAACQELSRAAALSLPAFGLGSDPAAKQVLVNDPEALAAMAHGGTDRMAGAIAAPAATVSGASPADSLAALQSGARASVFEAYDRVVALRLPSCPVSFPLTTPGKPASKSARRGGRGAGKASDGFKAAVARLEAEGVSLAQASMLVHGPWWLGLQRRANEVLQRGLGDRVHTMAVLPQWNGAVTAGADLARVGRKASCCVASSAPLEWPLHTPPPQPESLVVALTVRPRSAARLVDRGPAEAVDAEGAAAFTALWGSKAETRRFADGSIVPAVVWDPPPCQREEVVDCIVSHLATTHGFQAPRSQEVASLPSASGSIERFSQPEWAASSAADAKPGTPGAWRASAAAAVSALRSASDVLLRALQRAPGMPLKVSDLDVIGAQACITAAQPIRPHPLAHAPSGSPAGEQVPLHATPVDCLVSLESSAKWPKDLSAIAASKCAFLLKMKYGLPKVLGSSVSAHLRVPPALRAIFADVTPQAAALVGETPASLASQLASAAEQGSMPGLVDSDVETWCPCLIVMLDGYVFRLWLSLPQELAAWTALARKPVTQVLGSTALVAPLGGIFSAEAAVASGFVNVGRISGEGSKGAVLPPSHADDTEHLSPTAKAFVTPSAEAAASRAQALYRQSILAPRHTKAVTAFATVYPSFAGAVRLAGKWLGAAGMLPAHVSQQALELTVAHSMMDPRPFAVPCTSTAAFLRWLRWLATWDFASQPVLVDWDGSAQSSDAAALHSRFAALHRSGGAMPAWYLVTPWERGLWVPQYTGLGTGGSPGPSPIVAARIQAMASSALHRLVGHLRVQCLPSVAAPATPGAKRGREDAGDSATGEASALPPLQDTLLAEPPAGDFNVVVRLHSSHTLDSAGVGGKALVGTAFKNTLGPARRRLLLDWSPAQALVADIQRSALDSFAYAFPHPSGQAVYLAWKPTAFPAVPAASWRKVFKGSAGPKHGTTVATQHQALTLLWQLGQGVIKSITLTPN